MTRRERIETDALFMLTAGSGSRHALREIRIEGSSYWIAASDREGFERKLRGVQILGGAVSFVPRLRDDRYYFDRSACIWARVESGSAAEALQAFEPKPTLILQDGDTVKHTALWWLSRELGSNYVLKANERLSNELGGIRGAGAPQAMLVPPKAHIGVQEVHVAHVSLALYHPDEVVGSRRPGGRLADAPDLRALRKHHAEQRERQAVAA